MRISLSPAIFSCFKVQDPENLAAWYEGQIFYEPSTCGSSLPSIYRNGGRYGFLHSSSTLNMRECLDNSIISAPGMFDTDTYPQVISRIDVKGLQNSCPQIHQSGFEYYYNSDKTNLQYINKRYMQAGHLTMSIGSQDQDMVTQFDRHENSTISLSDIIIPRGSFATKSLCQT